MVHDRQIVGRKIPDDAHVVLKEAEVDARRVEVIERTERAGVDELANLPDSAAEKKRVVYHDLEVLAIRQLDELFGLS